MWNHTQWSNDKSVNQQKKRIVRYGDHAVNYMNSEDYSDSLGETVEYIDFMDQHANTDFKQVYPELISLFDSRL